MFGSLGVPEIIFLLVLALLVFGPRKLPEIGRTLGRGLAEFRKASNELRRTLNTEGLQEDVRQSDPRKMLREELTRPFQSSEEPEGESATASTETASSETVARGAQGEATTTPRPIPRQQRRSPQRAQSASTSRRESRQPGWACSD